jgi:hypothetical protein
VSSHQLTSWDMNLMYKIVSVNLISLAHDVDKRRGSVVGMATGYELDDRGFQS